MAKEKIFHENDLQQGSDAWLKWRTSHLGASEVGCLTGDSMFGNAVELWKLKTGRVPPIEVNSDMLRGKNLEPLIRRKVEEEHGEQLQQYCMEHAREDFLSASLDGFCEKTRKFYEIKAPRVKSHLYTCRRQEIPVWYKAQMLTQFAVIESHFGSFQGYFASYVTDEAICEYFEVDTPKVCGVPNLIIIPFEFKSETKDMLIPIARLFWDYVERDVEPHDFDKLRNSITGGKLRWD